MTNFALPSPSPSPSFDDSGHALEPHSSFLQRQRQRESSAGNFDHSREDPIIVQMNADRLHDKLSQLKAGLVPSRRMNEDDLYYMAKAPDQWPWERTDILTPTPPETPSSSVESLGSDFFVSVTRQRRVDLLPQPILASSVQQTQPKHASSAPQSRYISRKRQSNAKKVAGRIRKKASARKHSMATRSRCRGDCTASNHYGHI